MRLVCLEKSMKTIKLIGMAAFNLPSKIKTTKAQFSLSADGLVVRLWLYTSSVGCSNLHKQQFFSLCTELRCAEVYNKPLQLLKNANFSIKTTNE